MTKDGEVIVCHDDTFGRICDIDSIENKDQTVGETNFKDLPKFKNQLPIFFCPKG